MSKVGRRPVAVPKGVTVTVSAGTMTVKGPKGTLARPVPHGIAIRQEGEALLVERVGGGKVASMNHGSTRAHLANMVKGVHEGFSKTMILEGVGYRAQAGKGKVSLSLGFSHPVDYAVRAGVTVETPEPTKLVVSGCDIEAVGQVAAELRKYRPPEPYKGKGMRYEGEKIRRKAGKAAGK